MQPVAFKIVSKVLESTESFIHGKDLAISYSATPPVEEVTEEVASRFPRKVLPTKMTWHDVRVQCQRLLILFRVTNVLKSRKLTLPKKKKHEIRLSRPCRLTNSMISKTSRLQAFLNLISNVLPKWTRRFTSHLAINIDQTRLLITFLFTPEYRRQGIVCKCSLLWQDICACHSIHGWS